MYKAIKSTLIQWVSFKLALFKHCLPTKLNACPLGSHHHLWLNYLSTRFFATDLVFYLKCNLFKDWCSRFVVKIGLHAGEGSMNHRIL